MRYAPRGLLPDFISSSVEVMRAPVGVVGILIGVVILFRIFGNHLARLANRAIRAFSGIGGNDSCAISI